MATLFRNKEQMGGWERMSKDAKMGKEMNLSLAGYGMSYVLSSPYENVPTDLSSHVKDQ